jgi:malate dehydrogenase (oxaloacetate-decarboxylating)(NADP+)
LQPSAISRWRIRRAVADDADEAFTVTAKGNLVAVISNGTAVLGLGAIGPLAAKPVMEGKAVLFKKFAGIDVFDIEVDTTDVDRFVDVVASLEPTFGTINLEDIKAPECFEIERRLREQLNIPVFHDDQHGAAIVAGAAIVNGLRIAKKDLRKVRLVANGAGAAGIACLDLLVHMGLRKKNITLVDSQGVVHAGRAGGMTPEKSRYAAKTDARSLADALHGADIFLGVSVPGVLEPRMVKTMAERPLIMALANPVPEITPEDARAARPDAIIATGRSDYPNQVNNVLCFPFIFRGALDVGARAINEGMKAACLKAIADLATAESSEVVAKAYGDEELQFGPEYLIPKPFDPRLIVELAPAVAKVAMDSGVAARPIKDFDAYRDRLSEFVFRTGLLMRPIFDQAKNAPKRLVYAEGEDYRVLRAVQVVLDEGLAQPIVIGRPAVVETRIERLGLRIRPNRDFELVNPEEDPRYDAYWRTYHGIMERRGVSPDAARTIIRTDTTAIAALMVKRDEADAMICGTFGEYDRHLKQVLDVLGVREGAATVAALDVLLLPTGAFFLCDTHVSTDPSTVDIVEMTVLAAEFIRRFGLAPKAALLSHSDFGTVETASALKMREAVRLLSLRAPELEVEGEMRADTALSEEIRERVFPNSRLSGQPNLLVLPTLDAANIAFNLLKALGEGISVGSILLGAGAAAHVLTPAVSARGLVNMSALAVVDAQVHALA